MPKTRFVFLAATVVAGCGSYNFTPIPQCAKNQALTGDGNALKCIDVDTSTTQTAVTTDMATTPVAPVDMAMSIEPQLVVPTCAVGSCLTGDNAGQLQCIDVSVTNTTLAQALLDIQSLKSEVAALEKTVNGGGGGGGGTIGVYVGSTVAKTTGLISYNGMEAGLTSAAAYCNAEFTGAHMCSGSEMYLSAVNAKWDHTKTVPKSWVYAPSWQNPSGKAQQPTEGLGDNCAGYTYGTGDFGWTGVAVEWAASPAPHANGAYALLWHGGTTDAPCNANNTAGFSIACCK